MKSENQDEQALEMVISQTITILKLLSPNLKEEARRMLSISTRYTTQTNTTGILKHLMDSKSGFDEFQDYSNLLSKQFSTRVEELILKYHKVKSNLSTALTKAKARQSSEDGSAQIFKYQQQVNLLDEELASILKEEHFLTQNYRLNIAAKEIERWNPILRQDGGEEGEAKGVDDLFEQ